MQLVFPPLFQRMTKKEVKINESPVAKLKLGIQPPDWLIAEAGKEKRKTAVLAITLSPALFKQLLCRSH